jgi:predicted N-acyltransferase
MYSTEIVASIRSVSDKEWDALAGEDVTNSHGWLRTFEDTHAETPDRRYILVRGSAGLVATAVCSLRHRARGHGEVEAARFGRLKKIASLLSRLFLPRLNCGPPLLLSNQIPEEERRHVLDRLLDAIEAEAERLGAGVSFAPVPEQERELLSALRGRGYNCTDSSPLAHLDIRWRSFEEYLRFLATISRNSKRTVSEQIKGLRRSGIRIERIVDVSRHSARLHELMNAHCLRYNGISFPFTAAFFSHLKEQLGDDAVIYAAVRDDTLLGACIMIRRRRVGSVRMIGVDRAAAGNSFIYFNIAYYAPIRDAIEWGIERLYFGTTMYEIKLRRGCRMARMFTLHRFSSRYQNLVSKPLFWIHSFWFRLKLRPMWRRQRDGSKTLRSGRGNAAA